MRENRKSGSMRGRRKRACYNVTRLCPTLRGPPRGKNFFTLVGYDRQRHRRPKSLRSAVAIGYGGQVWNLWILPKVEKFPKSLRFSVGRNLTDSSLELLMNLVDASYQSRNAGTLATAVRNVNRVRYLVRLSKDLHLISAGGYEFAAAGLDEIGRMTGGWWKHASAR